MKNYSWVRSHTFSDFTHEKEIAFMGGNQSFGDISFTVRVDGEVTLVLIKAEERINYKLEKYCRENNLSMNSPERQKKLEELEEFYFKPIIKKYHL